MTKIHTLFSVSFFVCVCGGGVKNKIKCHLHDGEFYYAMCLSSW